MKHIILYLLITVFSMSLYAQETSLTINVSPGKLKEAMTEEQMKTVTSLTLTGEMDNSDFYTIRDHMRKLEKLDLNLVVADTIPEKAFQQSYISYIVLTKGLEYIQNRAFSNMRSSTLEFTGKFPILEEGIFEETYQTEYKIGKENSDCIIINDCVYSSDTTILYLAPKDAYEYIIVDKTKIISSYAFDGCFFRYGRIHIPESVDSIGDYAFKDVQANWPVRSDYFSPITVTCLGLIPPRLGKAVFSNKELNTCALFVPIESLELYKSTSQWGMFGTIKDYSKETSLTVNVTPGKLKEAMTEGQMASVKNLTLIGEMDNSDFYVLRDNMKNLEVLDMENVIADTIPKKGLASLSQMNKITLPSCLSIIQFAGLADCSNLSTVIWTSFPEKMEQSIFADCFNLRAFDVSKSNLDCISVDGVLFSSDGKKLLYFPCCKEKETYSIPERTEIIGECAFYSAMLTEVTLPSTLKEIGNDAFWTFPKCPTGSGNCMYLFKITCNALVPPSFVNAFHNANGTELWVPEGYETIYRQSNWGIFRWINGVTSIENQYSNDLKNWVENGILHLESEKIINSIRIIDTNGNTVSQAAVLNNYYDGAFIEISGIYFLKLEYGDGSFEFIKFVK